MFVPVWNQAEVQGKRAREILCSLDPCTYSLLTHSLAIQKAALSRSVQSSPPPDSFPI